MLSGLFALTGLVNRKIDMVERRQDKLELKVAEQYVSHAELDRRWEILIKVVMRIEQKIDHHVDTHKSK